MQCMPCLSKRCAHSLVTFSDSQSSCTACLFPTLCRYMFKYDSTHGKYDGDVVGSAEGLFINGKKIASYSKM